MTPNPGVGTFSSVSDATVVTPSLALRSATTWLKSTSAMTPNRPWSVLTKSRS